MWKANLTKDHYRDDMKFDGTDMEGQPHISMARQEFVDECDIANIISTIARTGIMPQGTRELKFSDSSSLPDYKHAMDVVAAANSHFASLPAEIRDQFKNDPQNLINFVEDDKNYDDAVKLGLLEPKLVEARKTAPSKAKASEPLTPENSKPPAALNEVD